MKAHLAYLTTPNPGVFILNIQPDGCDHDVLRFEISKAHLVNILIDGASLAFRENYTAQLGTNRVPEIQTESADVRTEHRA